MLPSVGQFDSPAATPLLTGSDCIPSDGAQATANRCAGVNPPVGRPARPGGAGRCLVREGTRHTSSVSRPVGCRDCGGEKMADVKAAETIEDRGRQWGSLGRTKGSASR